MLKKQLKALERMCGDEKRGNAFISDGHTYVTDGCQIVVMYCEIPELVEKYPLHKDSQRMVLDFIEAKWKYNVFCAMPPMNVLNEFIKERRIKRYTEMNSSLIYKVMDSDGVIHGMNPCRVREIYEALNVGKYEVAAYSKRAIDPIYFSSDNGMAMLLPCRVRNDGTYHYKGTVI